MAGIPRGGVVTVTVDGRNFAVKAQGERAKVPQAMADVLTGAVAAETLDARMVQPYYAKLLAESANLSIGISLEGEDVVAVLAVPKSE